MTTLNHLRDTRKADREKIAAALEAVAAEYGAEVDRRDETLGRRDVSLNIALNGVGAGIWICAGLHGGGRALISWHNNDSGKPGRKCRNFASRFYVCTRSGGGWGHTHHKATSCPETWDDLLLDLREGLALAAEGLAFEEEPETTAAAELEARCREAPELRPTRASEVPEGNAL